VVGVSTLVVGGFYSVPCVHFRWNGIRDWWPVLLPLHEDDHILNFPRLHYHIDGRFLNRKLWDHVNRIARNRYFCPGVTLTAWPLDQSGEAIEQAPVVSRRKQCARTVTPWEIEAAFSVARSKLNELRDYYVGRQCATRDGAWVCPHRGVRLDMEPVDGVITCPAHGLRIDATSGRVESAALARTEPPA